MLKLYIFTHIVLSIAGFYTLFKNRNNILLFKKEYVDFVLMKWKITLFFIALVLLCYMSTLGIDPTWDIPESIIMSILTYYTAPYSIGIIYRYIKGIDRNFYELYISIILLFFSSAWFYDLYVWLILLGEYPQTAFYNLGLSPFFYILAGIMWNMGYKNKEGLILLFTEKEWIYYKYSKGNFKNIFIYTLPIILFMIVLFGYFLYINI